MKHCDRIRLIVNEICIPTKCIPIWKAKTTKEEKKCVCTCSSQILVHTLIEASLRFTHRCNTYIGWMDTWVYYKRVGTFFDLLPFIQFISIAFVLLLRLLLSLILSHNLPFPIPSHRILTLTQYASFCWRQYWFWLNVMLMMPMAVQFIWIYMCHLAVPPVSHRY